MAFMVSAARAKDGMLVVRVRPVRIGRVDDARFCGLLIGPETNATELQVVDKETAESLWKLARRLGQELQVHCNADKINSAAIGNLVPQLHFHIVARHIGDAAWPQPIWGYGKAEPLAEATKAARIESIQSWLGN